MPTLASRNLLPELMDAPDLGVEEHRRALAGLARLNAASRTATQLATRVAQAAQLNGIQPVRVLDIAAGGGDVTGGMARRLASLGVECEVLGLDMSGTAVERANAIATQTPNVRFQQLDVFQEPLPAGYDVVTSSLFLHHLTEDQTVELLRRCAAAAGALVISDLIRSRLGHCLAQIACRTLSRSPIVHYDGPQSVASAYTRDEMRELLRRAGLTNAAVQRCWPERMMITWRRGDASNPR